MADATEPTHSPCCSSHGVAMTCDRYRRTHFVEVRPCCRVDADLLRAEGIDPDGPWQERIAPHATARAALTAAAQVQPMAQRGRDYAEGRWCGECRYGVVEDPPCCTQPASEADEREARCPCGALASDCRRDAAPEAELCMDPRCERDSHDHTRRDGFYGD